jgi:hypothetical protein
MNQVRVLIETPDGIGLFLSVRNHRCGRTAKEIEMTRGELNE